MFDPVLAEIRFGCGLSPRIAPPQSVGQMLRSLSGADLAARAFPIEPFSTYETRLRSYRDIVKRKRAARDTTQEDAADDEIKALRRQARIDRGGWIANALMRRTHTQDGFRERLAFFWADHFTTRGKANLMVHGTAPYIEDAIRPNLTGRFEDLLIAAATHPMMLHYLDQSQSFGPNSKFVKRRRPDRGLNENLAREILELHTLGVGGPYSQDDVRQLAELLTGLTFRPQDGFKFRAAVAEPGAETVLGNRYGGGDARLDDIHAVLRDLARHPSTARHIAGKLAVHFVSDTPSAALVAALEASYLETGGALKPLYRTLLEHPDAWAQRPANAKQPVAFVGSACRALAVADGRLAGKRLGTLRDGIILPLRNMGQPWQAPLGPDGWAEADEHWITPQGMAARMQWAMVMPQVLVPDLPDPRAFVRDALGPGAPQRVVFAAGAAENRAEGIALVLMSPAFQRH